MISETWNLGGAVPQTLKALSCLCRVRKEYLLGARSWKNEQVILEIRSTHRHADFQNGSQAKQICPGDVYRKSE